MIIIEEPGKKFIPGIKNLSVSTGVYIFQPTNISYTTSSYDVWIMILGISILVSSFFKRE